MNKKDIKLTLMCEMLKPLTCSDRLDVLSLLGTEDRSIEQLSLQSKKCQATVAGHLRVLCNGGLIKKAKRGQQVFYSLDQYVLPLVNEMKRMASCILEKNMGVIS